MPNTPDISISPADKRLYRPLTLTNGLRVMLVHTPNATKAAAAMTVDAGSSDDPPNRLGLAHFLEHMLFLGTQSYPEPDDYSQYIGQHGGRHNAFTAHQQTTFFFDVDADAMSGALDRFAPFFIHPLFNPDLVERERHAVHAEFSAQILDDQRRILAVHKHLMNPQHPYARFSSGNQHTLADNEHGAVRDDLIAFYHKHYTAKNMTLVVDGPEPLDTLETWVRERFAAIPNPHSHTRSTPPPLYGNASRPLDVNIRPVKDLRQLHLTFELPEARSQYRFKPVSLLASIIGHEGQGSLTEWLKQQGWINALSAGRSYGSDHETLLTIHIQLTELGEQHRDDITHAVFALIDTIKQTGVPKYIIEEQHQMAELAYHYQEDESLTDTVVNLSINLMRFPLHDVIYGDYRYDVPDTETDINALFAPYLAALTTANMVRSWVSPTADVEHQERWYRAEYSATQSDYTPLLNKRVQDALQLPAPNPFLPQDLTLPETPKQALPERLNTPSDVWFYPEHQFNTPKAQVRLQLHHAKVPQSPMYWVLTHLYSRTVNESLNSYSYPLHQAGLHYQLAATSRGLEMMLSGYHDKIPELMHTLLQTLKQAVPTEQDFKRDVNALRRSLNNRLKAKPYERALNELRTHFYEGSHHERVLLSALERVTLDDLHSFIQGFSDHIHSTLYVHGALSRNDALALHTKVHEHYPNTADAVRLASILHVPDGIHQHALRGEHTDNVLALYIQGESKDNAIRAQYALLGQILSNAYYQRMRTEKQLGYVVFAAQYPLRKVPGLIFIVQSPNASPAELLAESERFFSDYQPTLEATTPEQLDDYKQGLISLLREPAKTLGEKASVFWQDINRTNFAFDSREQQARAIEAVTLDQITALYRNRLLNKRSPWLLFTQGEDIANIADIDLHTAELTPFNDHTQGTP